MTAAVYRLDPNAGRIEPTGSALGDMLNAVGLATSAYQRHFGPVAAPWQLATVITRAGILAPRPTLRWHRP
jgi:hypothetical protein